MSFIPYSIFVLPFFSTTTHSSVWTAMCPRWDCQIQQRKTQDVRLDFNFREMTDCSHKSMFCLLKMYLVYSGPLLELDLPYSFFSFSLTLLSPSPSFLHPHTLHRSRGLRSQDSVRENKEEESHFVLERQVQGFALECGMLCKHCTILHVPFLFAIDTCIFSMDQSTERENE